MKTLGIQDFLEMKRQGEKIACMTAYDASFARAMERAGMDLVLVGDSLGMVIQGRDTTLGVSVEDMIYHSRQVAEGLERAMLVADLPFMSYATPEQALGNSARLMREGRARMVKMEGGAWLLETIRMLDERGVPVCAHLGLLPQSVHKLGGYQVQGREADAAQRLMQDALALQQAGALMLVLECVPATLAAEISLALDIPVIGIGAGVACDGQVLVLHDALGLNGDGPRFSRNFLDGASGIDDALRRYVSAVREQSFPGDAHSFR